MARYRKSTAAFLAVAVIAVLAVCSKTPTSSGDYISEGQNHMEEQEYSAAIESFQKAIEEDSLNADALYLHAKAVLRYNELTILDCMEYVTRIQTVQSSPESLLNFVNDDNWEHVNTVYSANILIARDLKPIFNEKTHGYYDKHDILLDYLVASTVKSILGLVDIFEPFGEIDRPGVFPNLGISWDNGTVSFDSTALMAWADSLKDNPEQFNETIDQLVNNLDESQEVILALAGEQLDVEVDDAELGGSVDSMKVALNQYRYTPGIDDDNDGRIDEELLDGKDNDGDGKIDEDFTL